MTNKLQAMMQTHCNEALRLLQIGSLTAGDTNTQLTSKQVRDIAYVQWQVTTSNSYVPSFQQHLNQFLSEYCAINLRIADI